MRTRYCAMYWKNQDSWNTSRFHTNGNSINLISDHDASRSTQQQLRFHSQPIEFIHFCSTKEGFQDQHDSVFPQCSLSTEETHLNMFQLVVKAILFRIFPTRDFGGRLLENPLIGKVQPGRLSPPTTFPKYGVSHGIHLHSLIPDSPTVPNTCRTTALHDE